ncbi:metallophosphoesterase [Haliangium sp.]|uniref:metallophosphoesterase n=1 Tax=Haliangium sp. TaxID=2663208 RepID=UPI003D11B6E0
MHDIVVVSDLHLGRGKNPESGRYHQLEAFFFDDDFERFCAWLCEQARDRKTALTLVLNGDTFDLLRIDPEPVGPGASMSERRYGPLMNPERAAETVGDILAGHERFADGLARVLMAGHEIVVLPGNHDSEMQWPLVQEAVAAALVERMGGLGAQPRAAQAAIEGLRFTPWFYYEPGRVWIEHGCQYDPDNACRYPLRTALGDRSDAVALTEPDLPLGSFFQRYLYNAFGNITFIVPNSRSNVRYFRWLLFNQPRLLARVTYSHAPFFFQVLRRIAKAATSTAELRGMHEHALDQLAAASGLDDRLRGIDNLKNVRGSAAAVTRDLLVEIGKSALWTLTIAFLGAGLWFAGFHAITGMQSGFGFKSILFLLLNFVFLTGSLLGLGWWLLRVPEAPATRPLRRTACDIAELAGVPLVVFGHSHEEVIQRIGGPPERPSWYFNTGTWIAVFAPDELVPRERVQYTFLRIRGHDAELLHWSPGRHEAVPVVLLEDNSPRALDRPALAPPAPAASTSRQVRDDAL